MSFSEVGADAFSAPRQFHKFLEFVASAPGGGVSRDQVDEAADRLTCWPAPGEPGAPARPAAARAARVLDAAIDAAYNEAARDVVMAMAPATLVAANGDPITAARALMGALHGIAHPGDIADACGIMWADGFLEVVRRAAETGDAGWIERADMEDKALRAELGGWARLEASREASTVFASLPDDGDFVAALMAIHPLITAEIATEVAERTLARYCAPPVRRLEFGPNIQTNPFDTYWAEPDKAGLALHEKARTLSRGHLAPPNLAAQALALEHTAQDTGNADLAAALKRHRLGMDGATMKDAVAHGISAAALMVMDFPPIKWVIPGYLTEGLTLLAGAPKIGKSWMALGLALAVAAGEKALGEIECEPGAVLYLALEDNFRRLQSRLRLMGVRNGPAALHFETSWPTVDEDCVPRMSAWLDAHPDARMIVVDVFAKIKSAKGGNRPQYDVDYKDVTALQRLALDRGIAIVLVHHTRKMESDDPFDAVSGTRGLTGSADSTFVLTRSPGQGGAALYGRGRDIEEVEKAVTFDPATCRWAMAGPIIELQASPERQAILSALKSAGEPMPLAAIAKAVRKSASNVSNMLGKMIEAGTVRKAATGLYEIAPPPARPWPLHTPPMNPMNPVNPSGSSQDSLDSLDSSICPKGR